ncbi:kinetochore protein Spc24 [Cynoglossus semilaevis]|uniref:kinetochore protein Spc24 n=1 Tax=Cynoglossus semilaevis TaxID=244447 RepID=UPI000495E6E2|nr:kinetochore protein Spc24 [Cynoglossus semilaevis]XP_008328970.1 kinetochore protein Spc24 [Cynoglossus semilaevis]
MAQGQKFQDLEEMGEALLEYINSSQTEKVKEIRSEQQALFELHVETKKVVTHILNEATQIEETVGQQLLDLEEEKQQREQELKNLEEQLRQCIAKSQISDSEIDLLKAELENLRRSEAQLEALQSEVDEDTTEVIPSAVYVAKLYHLITKIKWEYDTPPHTLRGVHYGKDLATPINMDTSAQSRCSVSDHLWDFVSTEW